MTKTNASRILEALGLPHELVTYEADDEAIDAVSVADKLGVDPEAVFKTLVAHGDKSGYLVFVIPGPYELDLKKAASASGNKKVELIRVKELQPLTGYIRGGCSPVGMKKPFPTFVDETAQLFDRIYVSAGIRGAQLHIAPDHLLRAVDGFYADLI